MKVRKIVTQEVYVPRLSEKIAEAHKKSGLTVAFTCESAGISRTYWYRLVGGNEPAIAEATLNKIEKLFGVNFGAEFEGSKAD